MFPNYEEQIILVLLHYSSKIRIKTGRQTRKNKKIIINLYNQYNNSPSRNCSACRQTSNNSIDN